MSRIHVTGDPLRGDAVRDVDDVEPRVIAIGVGTTTDAAIAALVDALGSSVGTARGWMRHYADRYEAKYGQPCVVALPRRGQ